MFGLFVISLGGRAYIDGSWKFLNLNMAIYFKSKRPLYFTTSLHIIIKSRCVNPSSIFEDDFFF